MIRLDQSHDLQKLNGCVHLKISHINNECINCRSWQGSNLRGQSPLDFKSNALTTRPQLLSYEMGLAVLVLGWVTICEC